MAHMGPLDQKHRRQNEGRGRLAETIAIWWLRIKGYYIENHRVQTPMGEIDLIARRGRTLVFVEVKLRRTHDAGLRAVTRTQQRRIARAAEIAAQTIIASKSPRSGVDIRFDVITLSPWSWPRHLIDAWRPD